MMLKYLIEYIGRTTMKHSALELTSVDDTGGITLENPNGHTCFIINSYTGPMGCSAAH
jgi:hypothetical protein